MGFFKKQIGRVDLKKKTQNDPTRCSLQGTDFKCNYDKGRLEENRSEKIQT